MAQIAGAAGFTRQRMDTENPLITP